MLACKCRAVKRYDWQKHHACENQTTQSDCACENQTTQSHCACESLQRQCAGKNQTKQSHYVSLVKIKNTKSLCLWKSTWHRAVFSYGVIEMQLRRTTSMIAFNRRLTSWGATPRPSEDLSKECSAEANFVLSVIRVNKSIGKLRNMTNMVTLSKVFHDKGKWTDLVFEISFERGEILLSLHENVSL